MRSRMGAVALPAVLALVAGMGIAQADTGAPAEPKGQAQTTPSTTAVPAAADANGGSANTRGIIVKMASGSVSVLGLTSASEAALHAVGEPSIDVSVGAAVAPATRVLLFDQLVDDATAEAAARDLESRPDVLWAVPDRRMHLVADSRATPVLPDDPKFPQQWDIWDSKRTNGGYSVRAPLLWGTTAGSRSVVVAIVDTGITTHPDLDSNVVAGYDFISDVRIANDGTARDSDPSDPGDWITQSEAASGFFSDCDPSDSSWHGTHVAGTVAAVRDNGIGIAGVAPGVRIQPLRALGKCGGYPSDIAAAIRWAVGGTVSGVPDNPTPAKVVSLSLGSTSSCSKVEQDAVNFVRSQGAVIVVAAGNESQPVSESSPANCNGVISVAATARDGSMASYSNYGEQIGDITISAPGGDLLYDSGILSTVNTGTTSPVSPGYAGYDGTSMATPHVAAAAALLYGLGVSGAANVEAALVDAVQRFPSGVRDACDTTRCGAGILDVSALAGDVAPTAPSAPTAVTATPADGSLTVAWSPPADTGGSDITSYTATSSPGGRSCTTSSTSCAITGLTNGNAYSVTVTATNAAGLTSAASSPISATPAAASATPGAVSAVRVTWKRVGATYTATLRWSAPVMGGGSAVDGYRARLGQFGSPYGSWTTLTSAAAVVPGIRPGTTYRVQIQARNASGYGATATFRLRR